jgi:hemerythrin
MANPTWREDLSLGIPVLDKDHRRVLEAIGRLVALGREVSQADRRSLEQAVAEMTGYAQAHFRREEMLMRLAGYPELKAHRRAHAALSAQAEELGAWFAARPDDPRTRRMCERLADMLVVHIQEEDLKIKPFVEKLSPARAA